MSAVQSGKTILVVEDNVDDVFFLRRVLKKAGLEESAIFTWDGEEAIRYLEERLTEPAALPRLMLLDLNMPRVNGIELMTWARAQPQLELLVMAVITSSAYEPDMEKAMQAGSHVYLLKYPSPTALSELAHFAATVNSVDALESLKLRKVTS